MSASNPEAGAAVMAAVFAYPRNQEERTTRIYYAMVFILAKTCSLALTFIPPSPDLATAMFGLSVFNFFVSFLLDACARRETKRWSGEDGPGTSLVYCFSETIFGAWVTNKVATKFSEFVNRVSGKGGAVHLSEDSDETVMDTMLSVFTSKEKDSLQRWARDISWAYNLGMLLKKVLAASIVVLRFLYDRWEQNEKLDIAARVVSSFVSLVLVDVLDGLAKEESRLRASPPQSGFRHKLFGWFQ